MRLRTTTLECGCVLEMDRVGTENVTTMKPCHPQCPNYAYAISVASLTKSVEFRGTPK